MAGLEGVAFGTIAAVCLTAQALTVRLASRRGRTVDVLYVVLLVNTVVLVPLAFVLDPEPVVTPVSVAVFVATGLLGTLVGRGLFYAGIKRVGASRAESIKASMPLYATILAVAFLGQSVTGGEFLGVVLIVVGVALVSWEGASTDLAAGEEVSLAAMGLPLAAAFFFGLEPVLATAGLREGTSVILGAAIKSATAAVAFTLYLAWRDSLPRPSDLPSSDGRWFLLAGIASTAFTLSFYAGLSVSRVAIVTPLMQTSPLLVTVLSAVYFRKLERVTPRLVAAAGVVVLGAVTVSLAG